ncbi:MAG TPA: UDP-2,3-diacylglucosamine diphosphatase LpxI [Acidobacteriota bacterium]|nr:UDP-2,3-diacylglucosamine diphosphatase LpxI [Acidobacteriota bacterium]HQG92850.1 UDP-2,3-diacylglucosamine diphosphatase LpxI [Acidobacteriota bacterium]HQK88489.1 UDP-2,3-diacylglucosamine diphosphatase LpxI [Acidobacteriota bacterium]
MSEPLPERLGLIAGGGEFPRMIARQCRQLGIPCHVAAIRDEADPAIAEDAASIQWLGIGKLGRLIRFFKDAGVTRAIMAGYVQHVRIFGRDRPDLRAISLLGRLPRRNTDAILGALADELGREGVQVVDSTLLLRDLVPPAGLLTRRAPDRQERIDLEYGLATAREIARLDLGQTVVVCRRVVVAVETLEGTDATIERAAALTRNEKLTVVKVSKPDQDMRFDVPLIGARTVEVLTRNRVSAMAVDAGRSLMLDKADVLQRLDTAGIALVGVAAPAVTLPAKW